jgi:histidinol dehydrogenase
MITILDNRKKGEEKLKNIINRNQLEFGEINEVVKEIIEKVKLLGDRAVLDYTEKFDGIRLENLLVSEDEIEEGYRSVDKKLINALKCAKENIKNYHKKQLKNSYMCNEKNGALLGQIIRPLERVGIYVPGGTASYPSTVLMNTVPAKIAGVKEVIMVTPPDKSGKISANILAAAKIAGVDKIFKVGGAQAVGALTFGTESIPSVDKIVGPGNIYVAMAKRMVYGYVGIDMIAGPSEILVIADEMANPKYLAADLLSQAEHDTMAASILITTSFTLGEKVRDEIIIQTEKLERKEIIKQSIKEYGCIIVVNSVEDAVEISNKIAPEHLELMVNEPLRYINMIKNAGAIFMGEYSPEPLGDYWAGPNHTLPTSGTARFYSPLGVDDFIKKSSLIFYDKNTLEEAKENIVIIAESEGLTAHANAVKVRFQ